MIIQSASGQGNAIFIVEIDNRPSRPVQVITIRSRTGLLCAFMVRHQTGPQTEKTAHRLSGSHIGRGGIAVIRIAVHHIIEIVNTQRQIGNTPGGTRRPFCSVRIIILNPKRRIGGFRKHHTGTALGFDRCGTVCAIGVPPFYARVIAARRR